MITKLLLSVAVSLGLLAVLFHFALGSAQPELWPRLVAVLASFAWGYGLLYLLISLLKTYLQALRFRLLLEAAWPEVPALSQIYLVALSRNMFVDMLPARLGELSYIAMLNRGYRVGGESCLSSLAVSFVFDLIALALMIATLLAVQLAGGNYQSWMAGVLLMLALLIISLLALLYPAVRVVNAAAGRIGWLRQGVGARALAFMKKVERALEQTRTAGITGRVLALSVSVRLSKYLALYSLFLGVATTRFPDLDTSVRTVFPALVSAEAGASLPVPAFMGFGTYEAGGMLALVALGASAGVSLIVMLALHVISQVFDYLLGGIGLVTFILTTGRRQEAGRRPFLRGWKRWLPIMVLLAAALALLAYEWRQVEKRGSLTPPAALTG